MSVRRSFLWSVIGQGASLAFTFSGSVALAHILSPREVGIFAASAATSGLIAIVTTFGLPAYIIQARELNRSTLETAFTVNVALNLLIAATVFGASLFSTFQLQHPEIGRVLLLLTVQPLIYIFEFRPSVMLQRELQFRPVGVAATAAAAINLVVSITLALLGASYMSLAYGQIVGSAVSVLLYNLMGRRHVGFRLSTSGWREMAVFGTRMLTITGAAVLGQRICELVLARFQGLAGLGLYSRASGLYTVVFQSLYGSVTRVLYAKMAQDYRETGDLGRPYLRGLELILALIGPVLAGIAVVSRPFVLHVYGAVWLPAAMPLSCLMISLLVVLTFALNVELFLIKGQIERQTRYEIVRAGVGVVAFSIGASFSLVGAALGRVVDTITGAIFYVPRMSELAGVSNNMVRRIYAHAILLVTAAVAPAAAAMTAFDWRADTPLWLLGLSIALGAVLWSTVLMMLDHPLVAEAARVIAVLRGPRLSAKEQR